MCLYKVSCWSVALYLSKLISFITYISLPTTNFLSFPNFLILQLTQSEAKEKLKNLQKAPEGRLLTQIFWFLVQPPFCYNLSNTRTLS